MSRKLFVNLPVKDLQKTVEFFTKLGFKFDPRFTDKNSTCMIIYEDGFVMLLEEKFFQTFTKKKISNAFKTTEVIVSIYLDSKKEVDEFIQKAVKAGGKTPNPTIDQDGMYDRSFQDLDGHLWEVFHMAEPEKVK